MKKIILLIGICGMMGGAKGQGAEKDASNNPLCPPIYTLDADVPFGLSFDTVGLWSGNSCNPYPNLGSENIIRFTPHCTNTYILQVESNTFNPTNTFPVSIKVSTGFCDSTGYACLTPYYTYQYQGYYKNKYYLTVDSNITYDILFDYFWNNDPPTGIGLQIFTAHVSNIQFFDITPDSMSVSWDGTFDDVVIEYGPKGFTPGTDTIAGTNGILLHNPISPQTFTGLVADSVYDFYFRDKCGVFSQNFLYRKKTAINCDSIPAMTCGSTNYYYTVYANHTFRQCAWNMGTQCGCVLTAPEKIWSFTPDTSGIYTILKSTSGWPFPLDCIIL